MPLCGQRRLWRSLPGSSTFRLFLHPHSLAPGSSLILLHTLNLTSSSQPFANLQQVKLHGTQDRAGGCSLEPAMTSNFHPSKLLHCLQQCRPHHPGLSVWVAFRADLGGRSEKQGRGPRTRLGFRSRGKRDETQQLPSALFPSIPLFPLLFLLQLGPSAHHITQMTEHSNQPACPLLLPAHLP